MLTGTFYLSLFSVLLVISSAAFNPTLSNIAEIQTGISHLILQPTSTGSNNLTFSLTYQPVVYSQLIFGIFQLDNMDGSSFVLLLKRISGLTYSYALQVNASTTLPISIKIMHSLIPASYSCVKQLGLIEMNLIADRVTTDRITYAQLNISANQTSPQLAIRVIPLLTACSGADVELEALPINNTFVNISNLASNDTNFGFRLIIFYVLPLHTNSLKLQTIRFKKIGLLINEYGIFNLTQTNIFVGLTGLMASYPLIMDCSLTNTLTCLDLTRAFFRILLISLATCPMYSSLSFAYQCQCNAGWYQNQSRCQPCHYSCLTCSSGGSDDCVQCNTSDMRILTQSPNITRCLCLTGYVENLQIGSACYACMDNCRQCSNYTTCDVCSKGYVYNKYYSSCDNRSQPTFRISKKKQKLNDIWIQIEFSQSIIGFDTSSVLTILLNGKQATYQTDGQSPLTVKLTLTEKQSNVTAFFYGTVQAKDSYLELDQQNSQRTIIMEGLYVYSNEETIVLSKLTETMPLLSNGLSYGRGILVFFGLMVLLADAIQFIQLVTYYLFLEATLPNNLKQFLTSLYETINAEVLPFELPNILAASEEISFNKPQNYETYDVDFDIIRGNMSTIMQLLALLCYYCLMAWLISKINKQNRLLDWLKNKFVKASYSNISQLFLSSQICILFVCCASLRDRSLNSPYKKLNFAAAIVLAFISTIFVFIHPLFLLMTKKQSRRDTTDCYSKTLRQNKQSQGYVFASLMVRIAVAVGIPLFPPMVALLAITLSSLLEFRITFLVKFQTEGIKRFRITYSVFYILLNLGLIVCVLGQQLQQKTLVMLGYVCMALILTNILRQIIQLLYDIVLATLEMLRLCRERKEKQQNQSKCAVKPVVHQKLEGNSPDISQIEEPKPMKQNHKVSRLKLPKDGKNHLKFVVHFINSSHQER